MFVGYVVLDVLLYTCNSEVMAYVVIEIVELTVKIVVIGVNVFNFFCGINQFDGDKN